MSRLQLGHQVRSKIPRLDFGPRAIAWDRPFAFEGSLQDSVGRSIHHVVPDRNRMFVVSFADAGFNLVVLLDGLRSGNADSSLHELCTSTRSFGFIEGCVSRAIAGGDNDGGHKWTPVEWGYTPG